MNARTLLALSLLSLVSVAGCKSSGDDGYAVDLTVLFDSAVSDAQIAQMTRLHLDVSDAETFSTDVTTAGKFTGRSSAIRYKPSPSTSGHLTLTLTAYADTDAFASGMLGVDLKTGATQTATLTLSALVNDVADMAMPIADLTSFDLNACGNGTVDPNETCDDGPGSTTPCPKTIADCDDHNSCTTDALTGTGCQAACTHTPLMNSSGCTVGTTNGVCLMGACCTGCISGGMCLSGASDPTNCGTAGNACFDCTKNSATATCNSGQCSGCDITSCTTASQTCGTSSCGFNCGSCPDSCASGTVTHYSCGGKTCQSSSTSTCSPYATCASATTCKTSCSADTDCVNGYFCNASNVCVLKLNNGASCTRAAQCSSNTCADGYCCDQACGGTCQACNVMGSLGTCTPIPAMQQPHTGHGSCTTDGTVCGGYCDGSTTNACFYPTVSCSQSPYPGTCSGGKCGCPANTIMCTANGMRCTPEAYNEFACGSATTMCSGSTPACVNTTCSAISTTQTTLASGFNFPHFIDQDASNVYITDTGNWTVNKQFKGSGNSQQLVKASASTIALVTDGTNVYYGVDGGSSGGGSVWKISVNGGTAVMIASGTNPWGMAIDSTYLYWSNQTAGSILRLPLAGGAATPIATGQNYPNMLTSDGTYVYWANGGTITHGTGSVARVPVGGGTVQTLIASQANPYGIAVDGTYVYWSNNGYNANDAGLYKMPLAGGTATSLLTGLANGGTVRVDPTGVYVVDTYSGIRKVPLCGGTPILIVPDTNYIDDMVVGSGSIFFVRESNGDIRAGTK